MVKFHERETDMNVKRRLLLSPMSEQNKIEERKATSRLLKHQAMTVLPQQAQHHTKLWDISKSVPHACESCVSSSATCRVESCTRSTRCHQTSWFSPWNCPCWVWRRPNWKHNTYIRTKYYAWKVVIETKNEPSHKLISILISQKSGVCPGARNHILQGFICLT